MSCIIYDDTQYIIKLRGNCWFCLNGQHMLNKVKDFCVESLSRTCAFESENVIFSICWIRICSPLRAWGYRQLLYCMGTSHYSWHKCPTTDGILLDSEYIWVQDTDWNGSQRCYWSEKSSWRREFCHIKSFCFFWRRFSRCQLEDQSMKYVCTNF